MTFTRPKPSMRDVQRAGREEVRMRLELLDHLNAILQSLGGRFEMSAMRYDAIDRANVDVYHDDASGMIVFQVKGWEGRRLTPRQRLLRRLLRDR